MLFALLGLYWRCIVVFDLLLSVVDLLAFSAFNARSRRRILHSMIMAGHGKRSLCPRPGSLIVGGGGGSNLDILDARRSALGGSCNAAVGWQSLSLATRLPLLVLGQWETVIDFVHGHKLLLPPPSVGTGHIGHVDLSSGGILGCATTIVAKAVLDAYNDPGGYVRRAKARLVSTQSLP
jgi:hypothetical protein